MVGNKKSRYHKLQLPRSEAVALHIKHVFPTATQHTLHITNKENDRQAGVGPWPTNWRADKLLIFQSPSAVRKENTVQF